MDSIPIKPRPGLTARNHALRDPVTVREAAETDLDPTKAVAPATERGDKNPNNRHDDAPTHELPIDAGGREALFNALDVRADHAEQSPNQALMRQRAYGRHALQTTPDGEQSANADTPAQDPHADLEA